MDALSYCCMCSWAVLCNTLFLTPLSTTCCILVTPSSTRVLGSKFQSELVSLAFLKHTHGWYGTCSIQVDVHVCRRCLTYSMPSLTQGKPRRIVIMWKHVKIVRQICQGNWPHIYSSWMESIQYYDFDLWSSGKQCFVNLDGPWWPMRKKYETLAHSALTRPWWKESVKVMVEKAWIPPALYTELNWSQNWISYFVNSSWLFLFPCRLQQVLNVWVNSSKYVNRFTIVRGRWIWNVHLYHDVCNATKDASQMEGCLEKILRTCKVRSQIQRGWEAKVAQEAALYQGLCD